MNPDNAQSEFNWPASMAPSKEMMAKIAKLLALSQSCCNEHEAALAGSKAREFLEKYNVTVGEVALAAQPSTEVVVQCSVHPDRWLLILVCVIDDMFQVKTVLRAHHAIGYLCICGLASNCSAAEATLRYWVGAITAMIRERGRDLRKKGKRSKSANARRVRSYRLGVALRIAHEAEQIPQTRDEGLILVGNAVARRHVEEKYSGRLKTVKARKTKIDPEVRMGYHDGRQLDPHGARPVLPEPRNPNAEPQGAEARS